jgi:Zn finger protein HypA/HybF involved in hydrogenase expression
MARRLNNDDRKKIVFEFKNKQVKCRTCGETFEIKPTAKFQRKYCLECSKKNKEYYDNLDSVTVDDCDD